MFKDPKVKQTVMKILNYILLAAITSAVTAYALMPSAEVSKLEELEALIDERFVGEADKTAIEDAAAAGMISALGDRWSYYIPAASYAAHMEQMNNAYVGIGVTVSRQEEPAGFLVEKIEPNGGALAAGMQIGDVIVEVNDQSVAEMNIETVKNMIRGDENTTVKLGVQRGEEKLHFDVERKQIQVQVASGVMLENNIGLVKINNFDERCADETLAAVDELVHQGAEALIFDVRFNPGGYKKELVAILDRLLPEGVLFRSELYNGETTEDKSDSRCLELPMAVLINGDSYSAAEFFAAALNEYDWAVIVGQPTVGKSYFQSTFELSDGSAVGLSTGKYYTPNGVSLADEGGLQPEVLVELDTKTMAQIYAGQVEPADDPQIQAAVKALQNAG